MTATVLTDAPVLTEDQLALLFGGAHTTNTFTDQLVDPALIQRVYEDLRWAPTAMNNQPLRLTVVETAEARQRLVSHMAPGNQDKTQAAPLTLVVAFDPRWHEHMPHLAPHREGAREQFEDKAEMREGMGRTNALIQAGYLLLALRAHGLQVGPMAGLDAAGVDAEFHAETGWKTLVVVNVGHAPDPEDADAQRPRSGRLEFEQASRVL